MGLCVRGRMPVTKLRQHDKAMESAPMSTLQLLTRVSRLAALAGIVALPCAAAVMPSATAEALARGEAQEVLVLLDDAAVQAEAATLRGQLRAPRDTAQIQQLKSARYQAIKSRVLGALPGAEHALLKPYSHLPMLFLRLDTSNALARLAARPEVVAIYPNATKFPILAQSLPLVGQPAATGAGDDGTGATVLVIDTGTTYTRAEFGSCTAPGVPASCKVVYYANNADASTSLDSLGHGTQVSGVVTGVAPGAKLAVYNVFGATNTTTDALIIDAINWAIANQATYNIVALNMSLGDGVKYTSACGNRGTNPFVNPIANARAAGILPVAASGNEAYTDGISAPACTPGAVSVGATYDANVGGIVYAACTDNTTQADKVACFSNSASFLTLLAPGARISVTGATVAGTSFSAPHVAGAAGVLRAAYDYETLDQTTARMTTGVAVTDPRNGIVKPRLDLAAAARPENDAFAAAAVLSGGSGTAPGHNALGTKESGEPDHAGNAGGRSVWWQWTAPASGQLSLDTIGSGFDTLLAIYTGTAVNALTSRAANDDGGAGGTSSLLLQVQSGTQYRIAVDGKNGVGGDMLLNWALNAAAQADLALSGTWTPEPVAQNADLTYSLTVANNGAQTATAVMLSDTLPAGASFVSASPACVYAAGSVNCDLGDLPNGASSAVGIVVRMPSAGAAVNTASVASDVPDAVAANNSITQTASVIAPLAAEDGDVPTLPEWAAISLMAGLIYSLGRPGHRRGQAG